MQRIKKSDTPMKKKYCIGVIVIIGFVLVSCSKTKADYPLSNLRAIASFSFKSYHNFGSNIYIEHEGDIDETNRYIVVHVPADAELSCLRPSIGLSPWTSCSPCNLEAVDFSAGQVEYEVTAQSGKKAYYIVEVLNDYIYQDAILLRLYLADIPQDTADADFDPEDPTFGRSSTPDSYADGARIQIYLAHGSGYDLSNQRTHINLSPSSRHATVEVSEKGDESDYKLFTDLDRIDYTLSEEVIFRVRSESGNVIRYYVTVRESSEEVMP